MRGGSGAQSVRRAHAVESFRCAADTIGQVEAGMAIFAVTRGQFSFIDVILHVLAACGPSRISIWTWTLAEYEIVNLSRMVTDGRITGGLLVVDGGARAANASMLRLWLATFGEGSVRYVHNHAKIATVEGAGLRVLMRGSMNLNCNPRLEQLDVTEGGADFDLVRRIESEIPIVAFDAPGGEVYRATRCSDRVETSEMKLFQEVRPWRK